MSTTSNLPAVAINGLVKSFGDVRAVDRLDMTISQGEIFGLLGPNGAGKTTAIRLLMGLEEPTAGAILINGVPVGAGGHDLKRKIGWVPQTSASDPLLTGREQLLMVAELYEVRDPKRRVDEEIADFGLNDAAGRQIRTYSGGMRKRLELAAGTIHRPDLLVLDEPTASLDVSTRHQMWDLIRSLNRSGTTVLLTTHYLDEADVLCDRIAVIDHGKLKTLDSPERLKQRYGSTEIQLAWNEPEEFEAACKAAEPLAPDVTVIEGYRRVSITGPDRVKLLDRLLDTFRRSAIGLPDSVQTVSINLDQVFARVTGREFDPLTGDMVGVGVERDHSQAETTSAVAGRSVEANAMPVSPISRPKASPPHTHLGSAIRVFLLNNKTFLKRWWWRLQRDRFTLGLALLQPALWLLLFGSMWENVITAGWTEGGYLRFITAGAVMMTVFNFGLMSGLEMIVDRERGALDRLYTAPVYPITIITSRFLFVSAIGAAQSLVIIAVSWAMGVEFEAGAWAVPGLLVLAALLGAGVAAASITLGLTVANHGQFYTVTGLIALPLILVSTVFAPLEVMPDWLAAIARVNPLTYAVNGARDLVVEGARVADFAAVAGILSAFVVVVLMIGVFTRRLRTG